MKAIRYEKDAVLIQDGKIETWIDIWIENEDVLCNWNKYIFIMTDSKDVNLKKWQDNLDHFEEATNLAIETLEKQGVIFQDNNGKWQRTEKYHSIKGSIPIQ